MKLDLLAAARALCQINTQAASQAPVTAENGKGDATLIHTSSQCG